MKDNYNTYMKTPKEVKISGYWPLVGSILLTSKCNLNCSYCSVTNLRNGPQFEATLLDVKRIMETELFGKCVMVDLLGGEPLLVKELPEIVSYLSKQNRITNMSTNGILLLERIKEIKSAGITNITVSLHKENTKQVSDIMSRVNAVHKCNVSMVITKDMVKSPQQIIENVAMFSDSGCGKFVFYIYRPMGDNKQYDQVITDQCQEYKDLRRKINGYFPNFCSWDVPVQTQSIIRRCRQPWYRIECDALGNTSICCGTEKRLDINIFTTPSENVINSMELMKLRQGLLSCDLPKICENCAILGEPSI